MWYLQISIACLLVGSIQSDGSSGHGGFSQQNLGHSGGNGFGFSDHSRSAGGFNGGSGVSSGYGAPQVHDVIGTFRGHSEESGLQRGHGGGSSNFGGYSGGSSSFGGHSGGFEAFGNNFGGVSHQVQSNRGYSGDVGSSRGPSVRHSSFGGESSGSRSFGGRSGGRSSPFADHSITSSGGRKSKSQAFADFSGGHFEVGHSQIDLPGARTVIRHPGGGIVNAGSGGDSGDVSGGYSSPKQTSILRQFPGQTHNGGGRGQKIHTRTYSSARRQVLPSAGGSQRSGYGQGSQRFSSFGSSNSDYSRRASSW